MNKTIKERIQQKDASIDVGRALMNKIVKKFISKKVLNHAAKKLTIPIVNDTMIFDSHMEPLYLMDFALNDLYFRITSDNIRKYLSDNDKDSIKHDILESKTNLTECYKLLIGVDKKEEEIIDSWISSKLSIFEIVDVRPPLIIVRDLFDTNSDNDNDDDNDNLETIIDRNGSKTLTKNMIWAFRLSKFAGLGATSGVSFLFSSAHKIRLLKTWEKIAEKSKSEQRNHLLYAYLFKAQRKYGIDVQSEIFM